VIVSNQVDGGDVSIELLKLFLEVFELGITLVEDLEGVLGLASPQPCVLSEGVEEFADVVLGALNGTSQQKNNLDDFLVFSNPIVEGLTLIFGLVLLVPVLNLLGGFQNVGSGTVNGGLNLLKGWLEGGLSCIEVHVDFEEGLEDLLGCITATANTFLHLVQRVLGSVKKCLIHAPVVIFGQLLDFFSADGLNMLVKLVGANSLNEVFDSTFNFVILALKFLTFNRDPLLLHLNKLIKRIGSRVLGQVN
jgi:hypothetical protein